jgi:hypothetical protein
MITNRHSNSPKSRSFWRGADRSQGMVEFALALPILLVFIFAIIDFSLLFSAWILIQNMSRQSVRYAVTGDYDPTYCPAAHPDCTVDGDTALQSQLQDAARLQSIHDVAAHYRSGLLWDQALWDAQYSGSYTTAQKIADRQNPGYLSVVVCSSRRNSSNVPMYDPWAGTTGSGTYYGDCLPHGGDYNTSTTVEDPGGPGDDVTVMVDFNNPFITPFLQLFSIIPGGSTIAGRNSTWWEMVHLSSNQRGTVEKFRIARMYSLNSGGGMSYHHTDTPVTPDTATFTPSRTATRTSTYTQTPSASATPTNTPSNTPTRTNTPTTTPTITCDMFVFTTDFSEYYYQTSPSGMAVQISIKNNSGQKANITNVSFDWGWFDYNYPTQSISGIRYTSPILLTPIGNQTGSPSTWAMGTYNSNYDLAIGATKTIQVEFVQAGTWDPKITTGSFGMVVTLNNGCTVVHLADPTPTFTPSNTPSKTSTPTPSRTATSSRTITNTPTISNTPTMSATRTSTGTKTNTYTPTSTVPTNTPTRTYTPSNTVPTNTFTRTYTPTATVPTNTFTRTYTPTATVPTSTFTPSKTSTPTVPTSTFTRTSTPSETFTKTFTPSNTYTPTPSKTSTPSLTPSNTSTPSNTPTKTTTPTYTPTNTRTMTPTPPPSPTPSRTNTPSPTDTKCSTCYG